jgi:3-oxoacyl-[acyl-carrier protein] reductase
MKSLQAGGKAIVIRADVGKVAEIKHLVSETIKQLSRVDILVNNSAILIPGKGTLFYKSPICIN